MNDCIFCKIANGEIPSQVVYEDERVLAFDDINPQAPVHTLIVPKKHYENLESTISNEELGYLFNTVKKIAEIKGINESGYRAIVNTGKDAQQTVYHIHVHVLGGTSLSFGSEIAE